MERSQARKTQLATLGWEADKEETAEERLKMVAKFVFPPELR